MLTCSVTCVHIGIIEIKPNHVGCHTMIYNDVTACFVLNITVLIQFYTIVKNPAYYLAKDRALTIGNKSTMCTWNEKKNIYARTQIFIINNIL